MRKKRSESRQETRVTSSSIGNTLMKPDNCQVEPPYPTAPDVHVVVFSIRDPDRVAHRKHIDCDEEYPHRITECGMFEHGREDDTL